MKPFPEHDLEWVDTLPYYGTVSRDPEGRLTVIKMASLFPGVRCSYREHVEGGFAPSKEVTPEGRWFNAMMCEQTAAFAGVIGEYTRMLYGRERMIAIFKILAEAEQRYTDMGFGTRAWMHGVCQKAMA